MADKIIKGVRTTQCEGRAPSKGEVHLSFATNDGTFSLVTYALPLEAAVALHRDLGIAINVALGPKC